MERPNFIPESELKGGKQQIVIADIGSVVELRAKDVAAEKSAESTEAPKGIWNKLKNFGKTVWKRSELAQTVERYKAEKKIAETGNLFAHLPEEGGNEAEKQAKLAESKKAHDNTVKAVTDRFATSKEFEKNFIHTEAGEQRAELGDTSFRRDIIKLIKQYASGSINEERFLNEKNELLGRVKKEVGPEIVDKGKMYADNLFEVAKWARDYVSKQVEQGLDHTVAIDRLDGHFEVVVGKAREAVRTEAQLNAVDRITNTIQKYTGGVFNEATVAVGIAAVYGTASKIVQGSLKKAASVFGLGMVATGTVGAMRESRKLELERAQHAREKAQGKEVKGDANKAERRKEMEESRIGFKKSVDISSELDSKLFSKLIDKESKDLSQEEYNQALSVLGDLEARVQISDTGIQKPGWLHGKNKYKVDLIGYSNITETAKEQGQLDIMRAKAKILLKKWSDQHGHNFEQDLTTAIQSSTQEIFQSDSGILKQNERFAAMKKVKVRKAFIKSALLSGAFGLAIQETRAFFDNETQGAVEHVVQEIRGQHHIPVSGEKTTLAEGAFRRSKELVNEIFPTTSGPAHEVMLNAHKFKLGDGIEFQADSSTPDANDYYLVDNAGNKISDRLQMNADGSLSTDAKKWLVEHGYSLNESSVAGIAGGIHELNSKETLEKFPHLAKHVRQDWHDEPGSFMSEIHGKAIEFEGKQQMGYLEKIGDKVYLNTSKVISNFEEEIRDRVNDPNFGQVAGYTNPDGTPFVDPKMQHLKDQIIDAINNGTLREHFQAVVIPTEGANHDGLSDLMQGADANGRIALGEEWSKLFTKPEHLRDGHLPFKFLELRFDGHTLATARGMAEQATPVGFTEIINPESGVPFEVVPPIPVYRGRRPGLEEMERKPIIIDGPPDLPPRGSLSYGNVSAERIRMYKENFSARLSENPDIDLDHFQELEDYFNRMDTQRLMKTKILAHQAGEMNHSTTIAVNIPVAGHQEGASIYSSLKNYTNQTLNTDKFEINLFVNHPDMDPNGNPVHPDQTLAEIKRFQQDFPNINVRVMYQVLSKEEAKIGNIRKFLNDAVLWRHHQRGQNVPDLIVVSNDADNKGMSADYLQNFENKFAQNPKVDAFLGQVDWDPNAYVSNPLMHVGTRFFQYIDSQARKRDSSLTQSGGANFAFKSSIYAAVDGYDDTDTLGEDVVLGAMIKTARSGAKDSERVGIKFAGAKSSRLYTSARRAMNALEKGLSPIEQWQSGFSAFDDEIRKYQIKEGGIDFDNEEEVKVFLKDLERVLNRTLDLMHGKGNAYWQNKPEGKEIDKAFKLLGISYEIDHDGSIKIIDAGKLLEGLKKYKIDGLSLMQKKIENKDRQKAKEEALKHDFESNPFSFINNKKTIDEWKAKGIKITRLVPLLFEQNGLSGEYDLATNEALYVRGGSVPARTLAILARLISDRRPELLTQWKAVKPNEYKGWAITINTKEVRDKFGSNSLLDSDIDSLARKYSLEPLVFLERIVRDRPSVNRRVAEIRTANPGATMEQVLRKSLREVQGIPEPTSTRGAASPSRLATGRRRAGGAPGGVDARGSARDRELDDLNSLKDLSNIIKTLKDSEPKAKAKKAGTTAAKKTSKKVSGALQPNDSAPIPASTTTRNSKKKLKIP